MSRSAQLGLLPWALVLAVWVVACAGEAAVPASADAVPDVAEPDARPVRCQSALVCSDKVAVAPCQVADCVGGSCVAVAAPLWAACDRGGLGVCERGACNASGVCVPVTAADGTPCDLARWNLCRGQRCEDGVCRSFPLVPCAAGGMHPVCEPGTGTCRGCAGDADCVGNAAGQRCLSDGSCAQ